MRMYHQQVKKKTVTIVSVRNVQEFEAAIQEGIPPGAFIKFVGETFGEQILPEQITDLTVPKPPPTIRKQDSEKSFAEKKFFIKVPDSLEVVGTRNSILQKETLPTTSVPAKEVTVTLPIKKGWFSRETWFGTKNKKDSERFVLLKYPAKCVYCENTANWGDQKLYKPTCDNCKQKIEAANA